MSILAPYGNQLIDIIKTDPAALNGRVQVWLRGGSTAINTSDWQALQDIYSESPQLRNLTDGQWGGSLPWSYLPTTDPCTTRIQGISCFEGRVYSVALGSLGWSGTVPRSFGNIARLTSLDLSNNQLVR